MDKKKKSILIVDDEKINLHILLGIFDDAYDLYVALNGVEALEMAKSLDIDLILLDVIMPQMDGFEVCETLKKDEETKGIPVIFVSIKNDEASIEKAYDLGGSDFITKPFKSKELLAKVKKELELKSLLEHLEYLSSYDTMTGIYNRRSFFELAQKKFNTTNNLYAVMIDVDDFKLINDRFGHHAGDQVLIHVVKTIKKQLSSKAIFGRLGGEEFCILLENVAKLVNIQNYMESIRRVISTNSLKINNEEIICTVSFGMAKKTKNTKTLDQLLIKADQYLYTAKSKGKNCVAVA